MKINLLSGLLKLKKYIKAEFIFFAFNLVFGPYGKHSGYVVNPIAITLH